MKTDEKIRIEGRLSTLETLVSEIKDNHLAHIEAKIDRITWGLVLGLGGLTADLLARFFFK